jgi:hypothetical protein
MMKKWGGLFYDKPWTAVRFEQAWSAPNNAGLVVDENGNRVDAEGNRFDPNTGRKLDPVKDKFLIGKRELVTVPAWACSQGQAVTRDRSRQAPHRQELVQHRVPG